MVTLGLQIFSFRNSQICFPQYAEYILAICKLSTTNVVDLKQMSPRNHGLEPKDSDVKPFQKKENKYTEMLSSNGYYLVYA